MTANIRVYEIKFNKKGLRKKGLGKRMRYVVILNGTMSILQLTDIVLYVLAWIR